MAAARPAAPAAGLARSSRSPSSSRAAARSSTAGTRIGRNMEPFTIYKFRTLAGRRRAAHRRAPADAGRSALHADRPLPEAHQARRDPAALERHPRRHEPGRPAARSGRSSSRRRCARSANYAARFVVRPGMTGLAQLRGGYFTHPRDKLRYDMLYIRNRGFWLDVKLVLATFVKLLNRWLTLGLLLALIFLSRVVRAGLFRCPFELEIGGFNLSPFEVLGLLLAAVALAAPDPGAPALPLPHADQPADALLRRCSPSSRAWSRGDLVAAPARRRVLHGLGLPALLPGRERRHEPRLRAPRDARRRARGGRRGAARHPRGRARDARGAAAGAGGGGLPRLVVDARQPGRPRGLPRARRAARAASSCVCAERREERDFWLICTTLVLVGVLLTQTRTGAPRPLAHGRGLRLARVAAGVPAGRSARRSASSASWCSAGALRLSPARPRRGVRTRRVARDRGDARARRRRGSRGLIGTDPGKGAVSAGRGRAAAPTAAPRGCTTRTCT